VAGTSMNYRPDTGSGMRFKFNWCRAGDITFCITKRVRGENSQPKVAHAVFLPGPLFPLPPKLDIGLLREDHRLLGKGRHAIPDHRGKLGCG
jgi:hypothetical protein